MEVRMGGGKRRGRRRRQKNQERKRPIHSSECRSVKRLPREFPDLKFGEFTKEVAKRWKAMHDRSVWVEMARKEKEELQGGHEGEVEDVVEVPVDGKGGDEDEDGESDG